MTRKSATKQRDRVGRAALETSGGFVLATGTASRGFCNLAELEELLVVNLLDELLETSHAANVTALYAAVVTTTADAWNNASALNALLEAANDVRAAFVGVLFDLYVGSHRRA